MKVSHAECISTSVYRRARSPPEILFASITVQLIPFACVTLSPSLPFWEPLFCISVSVCFVCFGLFVFLYSTYEWNHRVFIFLRLTYSLSIIPSRSIPLSKMARFHLFSGADSCSIVYIYHIFYFNKIMEVVHFRAKITFCLFKTLLFIYSSSTTSQDKSEAFSATGI